MGRRRDARGVSRLAQGRPRSEGSRGHPRVPRQRRYLARRGGRGVARRNHHRPGGDRARLQGRGRLPPRRVHRARLERTAAVRRAHRAVGGARQRLCRWGSPPARGHHRSWLQHPLERADRRGRRARRLGVRRQWCSPVRRCQGLSVQDRRRRRSHQHQHCLGEQGLTQSFRARRRHWSGQRRRHAGTRGEARDGSWHIAQERHNGGHVQGLQPCCADVEAGDDGWSQCRRRRCVGPRGRQRSRYSFRYPLAASLRRHHRPFAPRRPITGDGAVLRRGWHGHQRRRTTQDRALVPARGLPAGSGRRSRRHPDSAAGPRGIHGRARGNGRGAGDPRPQVQARRRLQLRCHVPRHADAARQARCRRVGSQPLRRRV